MMSKIIHILLFMIIGGSIEVVGQRREMSNEMHPNWSPDGDQIVFYSNKAGNEDIYVISVSSGKKTQLTNNVSADSQPAWSPNGEWIAFESDRNGDFDIYLVRPDGTGLKRITSTPNREMTPAWSPDGKKLIYEIDFKGNWQLFTIDLESNRIVQLTDAKKDHLAACWSSDGKSIYYSSSSRGNHQTDVEIHSINLLDKSQREITINSGVSSNITISPETDKVIFNTHRDGNWEIYSMASNGRNAKRLTYNDQKLEAFEFSDIDGEPDISPDGKQIVFLSGRSGSFDICTMNSDGTNFKNLTKNW